MSCSRNPDGSCTGQNLGIYAYCDSDCSYKSFNTGGFQPAPPPSPSGAPAIVNSSSCYWDANQNSCAGNCDSNPGYSCGATPYGGCGCLITYDAKTGPYSCYWDSSQGGCVGNCVNSGYICSSASPGGGCLCTSNAYAPVDPTWWNTISY
jgi:hypothetical protein